MFTGAMLCILPIPGAQALGIGMITGGFFYTLDGMANGERPYYRDSETREVSSFGKTPS